MIYDAAPIARLRQVFFSWFIVLALVLSWLGGAATTRASFATGSTAGLAFPVAQDDVVTLSTAWKVARAPEHGSGHDPDEFFLTVGPMALPEGVGTGDVRRTTAILRITLSPGLPQSRAPPLT